MALLRPIRSILCALVLLPALPQVAVAAAPMSLAWDGVAAAGIHPGLIAADGAGRVYVPDATTGVVYIYSSAATGNRLLTTIGAGILQQPYAVNIDNRETIYVADRGLNKVAMFDRYGIGLTYNGAIGGPGGAIGQFDAPAQLVSDIEPRLFTLESNNRRVQVFDPSATDLKPLFAFGVGEPGAFDNLSGIAVDSNQRVFISSTTAAGSIRAFDTNGALLGPFATDLSSPTGLRADAVDRIITAETGANRIDVFSSLANGGAKLADIGSGGSGDNEFSGPTSVALAPGALLYVGDPGNGRVVRIRYDDADRDGAIDATDVCPGLSNPDQEDSDHDGLGNPCDADDDADGVNDGNDRCPDSTAQRDTNKDGCTDPYSRVLYPRDNATFRGRGPALVSGIAFADTLGVARVKVALARRTASGCLWFRAKGRRGGAWVGGKCAQPKFNAGIGDRRWRLVLGSAASRPGNYFVITQAVQSGTELAEPRATDSSHDFHVRSH